MGGRVKSKLKPNSAKAEAKLQAWAGLTLAKVLHFYGNFIQRQYKSIIREERIMQGLKYSIMLNKMMFGPYLNPVNELPKNIFNGVEFTVKVTLTVLSEPLANIVFSFP